MRGYITFLLVLSSLFFTLILIGASQKPYDISFSKAIAAERTYGVAMNSKEVAAEAIRQGSLEAFNLYETTHSAAECYVEPFFEKNPFCYREEEVPLWVKAGAFIRLATLDKSAFDSDMEVEIYCTPLATDDLLRQEASAMRTGGAPDPKKFITYVASTTNVSELALSFITLPENDNDPVVYHTDKIPTCMASITPTFRKTGVKDLDLTMITIDTPLVVSVYYPDFNISAVSYLPASYKIYEASP